MENASPQVRLDLLKCQENLFASAPPCPEPFGCCKSFGHISVSFFCCLNVVTLEVAFGFALAKTPWP